MSKLADDYPKILIPAPELAGKTRSWRFGVDVWLSVIFVLFCILSIFIIYDPTSSSNLLRKQITNYAFAFAVFVAISQIPSNLLKILTPYLFMTGIVLLIVVLFFGSEGKGARRWINLGIFNIQPSEFFKILLPMMLAWWFNLADENSLNKYWTWFVVFAMIGSSVLLIAIQPDLGTALMILMGGLVTIFLVGLPWRIILISALMTIVSLPFLWSNMHAYQKQRVLTFLDPYKDPLGSGYHVIQSMIAIGSGGLLGQGWLQGKQSRLDFVPEQHTDFVFSIIAEEYGLIGSLSLIFLYLLLMWRGIYTSYRAQTHFLKILTTTLSIMIFFYVLVNVSMVIGLLPIVGLPLPLISYGGSSLITYAIILGILSSVRHQTL